MVQWDSLTPAGKEVHCDGLYEVDDSYSVRTPRVPTERSV